LTTISDVNHDEIKKILSVNLTKFRGREISYGISLTGPHRDDLEIKLNDQMASKYASRGQSRIITLALKLSEASLLKELNNRTPILALDDILSELDKNTQGSVLKAIENYEQVFITAADLGTFKPEHLSKAALYTVVDGTVSTK
jgi:DNA replication and repair protein RecF